MIACRFLAKLGTPESYDNIFILGSSKLFLTLRLTFLLFSYLLLDRLSSILFSRLCICLFTSLAILVFCFSPSASLLSNIFLTSILLLVVALRTSSCVFSLRMMSVPVLYSPLRTALTACFCRKLCIFLWYILYLGSPFSS